MKLFTPVMTLLWGVALFIAAKYIPNPFSDETNGILPVTAPFDMVLFVVLGTILFIVGTVALTILGRRMWRGKMLDDLRDEGMLVGEHYRHPRFYTRLNGYDIVVDRREKKLALFNMSVKHVYIFKEIDDFVITRDPSNNKIYLQFFLGFKGVVVVRVRVVSSEHGQKLIKSMRNVVKDKLVSNAEREFAEILKTPIKKESKKKSDEEEEVEVVIHGEKSKKTPAEPTVIDEEQRDNELKRRRAMELDKLRMMKEEQDRMIEAEEMRLLDESSMGEADAGESAVTEPGENDTMEAPTSLKTTESLPDEIQQAAEAVLKAAAERRAMRKKNAPDNPELTKSDKNQDQTA